VYKLANRLAKFLKCTEALSGRAWLNVTGVGGWHRSNTCSQFTAGRQECVPFIQRHQKLVSVESNHRSIDKHVQAAV